LFRHSGIRHLDIDSSFEFRHSDFPVMLPAMFFYALSTAVSLAVACAVLSVLVVSRRWAFIGEGISHSGFGGAGTAWVLALLFPAIETDWLPFLCVIVFCLLTALAIGFLSRRQRVNSDAAIGIFMVASLAWGFLSRELYRAHRHMEPVGFDDFLFGQMGAISPRYALATVMLSAAIIVIVAALAKEILYYCFDPVMAEASGVRAGFIHYLLMLLVALTIVLGVRVAGSVLVTALLVLPGATALLLSQRLRTVMTTAIVVAITGAAGGVLISARWQHVPTGPAIVLVLFIEFLACYAASRLALAPNAAAS
jgi:ABC-type Mn2+/Zn2+ transport system permease subunit